MWGKCDEANHQINCFPWAKNFHHNSHHKGLYILLCLSCLTWNFQMHAFLQHLPIVNRPKMQLGRTGNLHQLCPGEIIAGDDTFPFLLKAVQSYTATISVLDPWSCFILKFLTWPFMAVRIHFHTQICHKNTWHHLRAFWWEWCIFAVSLYFSVK